MYKYFVSYKKYITYFRARNYKYNYCKAHTSISYNIEKKKLNILNIPKYVYFNTRARIYTILFKCISYN